MTCGWWAWYKYNQTIHHKFGNGVRFTYIYNTNAYDDSGMVSMEGPVRALPKMQVLCTLALQLLAKPI